jgi:glyoxylase-like metal-dependent hydrolase (beta-lactamase superfamily II)
MVSRLTEAVWQFDLRGVNAYLVDDDVLTLVDAGTPFDKNAIQSGLLEIGYAVGDIDRVLLTHYDLDHVGSLAGLEPELDAPVYIGAHDGAVLTGDRSPPLSNHKGALQRALGLLVTDPDLEIRTLEDGDELGSFTAYHTPGHTPGHFAFVSREQRTGLLGDLVTESGGALEPSGWLMSYDTGAVRDSIQSLSAHAAAFDIACIGHGTPLTANGSGAVRSLASG